MKRMINLRGFLYLTVCRMELVKTEGLSKGWAGKWLKVDVSYKVWKVWPIFRALWRVTMRPTIEIASTILSLVIFPYPLASEAIDT